MKERVKNRKLSYLMMINIIPIEDLLYIDGLFLSNDILLKNLQKRNVRLLREGIHILDIYER